MIIPRELWRFTILLYSSLEILGTFNASGPQITRHTFSDFLDFCPPFNTLMEWEDLDRQLTWKFWSCCFQGDHNFGVLHSKLVRDQRGLRQSLNNQNSPRDNYIPKNLHPLTNLCCTRGFCTGSNDVQVSKALTCCHHLLQKVLPPEK